MTEFAPGDVPHSLCGLAQASQDLTKHFSILTLQLIGIENATELLEKRATIEAFAADAKGLEESSENPELLELDKYLDAGVPAVIEDINIACSLPDQTTLLGKDYVLLGLYQKAKRVYEPLDDAVVDQFIEREEDYVVQLTALKEEIADIFRQYDETTDQSHKDSLLRDATIALRRSQLSSPREKQRFSLAAHLKAEAKLSRLERLEFQPGRAQSNLPVAEARGLAHTYEYAPPLVARKRWDRLVLIEDCLKALYLPLAYYERLCSSLMQEFAPRYLVGTMATGLGAVALARDVLLTGPAPTGHMEILFSLRDGLDTNSKTLASASDLQAIRTLICAPLLSKVQQEITTLLTGFDSPSKDRVSTMWQDTVRAFDVKWKETLSGAEQAAVGILTQNLDNILSRIKPYAAVALGQKPRPSRTSKKQTKNVTESADAVAARINDQLHREGDFTRTEQVLVASILAGNWDEIKNLSEQARHRYKTILAFASEHNLEKSIQPHPIHGIMQFSPERILKAARPKIDKLSQTTRSAWTPEQHSRLQMALASLDEHQ